MEFFFWNVRQGFFLLYLICSSRSSNDLKIDVFFLCELHPFEQTNALLHTRFNKIKIFFLFFSGVYQQLEYSDREIWWEGSESPVFLVYFLQYSPTRMIPKLGKKILFRQLSRGWILLLYGEQSNQHGHDADMVVHFPSIHIIWVIWQTQLGKRESIWWKTFGRVYQLLKQGRKVDIWFLGDTKINQGFANQKICLCISGFFPLFLFPNKFRIQFREDEHRVPQGRSARHQRCGT